MDAHRCRSRRRRGGGLRGGCPARRTAGGLRTAPAAAGAEQARQRAPRPAEAPKPQRTAGWVRASRRATRRPRARHRAPAAQPSCFLPPARARARLGAPATRRLARTGLRGQLQQGRCRRTWARSAGARSARTPRPRARRRRATHRQRCGARGVSKAECTTAKRRARHAPAARDRARLREQHG